MLRGKPRLWLRTLHIHSHHRSQFSQIGVTTSFPLRSFHTLQCICAPYTRRACDLAARSRHTFARKRITRQALQKNKQYSKPSQPQRKAKSKCLSHFTNTGEMWRDAGILIRDSRAQKAYRVQQRVLGFDVAANGTKHTHKSRTRVIFFFTFDPLMIWPTKSTGIDHFCYSVSLYTR